MKHSSQTARESTKKARKSPFGSGGSPAPRASASVKPPLLLGSLHPLCDRPQRDSRARTLNP